MAQQPLVGQGLFLIQDSRSQSTRHTTLGRTPLDEWPARRRGLYLTTHNNLKRHVYPCPRRDSNPKSHQANGRSPIFRWRGHWDRLRFCIRHHKSNYIIIAMQCTSSSSSSSSSSSYSVLSSTNRLTRLCDSNKCFLVLLFPPLRRSFDSRCSRCSARKVSSRNRRFCIFWCRQFLQLWKRVYLLT
jgi:hypothetical protein